MSLISDVHILSDAGDVEQTVSVSLPVRPQGVLTHDSDDGEEREVSRSLRPNS